MSSRLRFFSFAYMHVYVCSPRDLQPWLFPHQLTRIRVQTSMTLHHHLEFVDLDSLLNAFFLELLSRRLLGMAMCICEFYLLNFLY